MIVCICRWSMHRTSGRKSISIRHLPSFRTAGRRSKRRIDREINMSMLFSADMIISKRALHRNFVCLTISIHMVTSELYIASIRCCISGGRRRAILNNWRINICLSVSVVAISLGRVVCFRLNKFSLYRGYWRACFSYIYVLKCSLRDLQFCG